MKDKYVLEDGQLRPEPDLMAWAKWYETADRHVAKTEAEKYVVSTVFLGMDHSFGEGPPVLFETMVFKRGDWDNIKENGLADQDCERYCTMDEAKAGHETMVAKWSVSAPDSASAPED